MSQIFANQTNSRLAQTITANQTNIILLSGDGKKFPDLVSPGDYYLITIQNNETFEICKVTSKSGDTLTVERHQENTKSIEFPKNSTVAIRLTAGTIENIIANALRYKGLWNVSNNSLPSNPEVGDMYVLIGAGTVGAITYNDGESVFWSGQNWIKLKATSQVTSINGQTGAVTIDGGLIGLGNVVNLKQLAVNNDLSDLKDANKARANLGVDEAGSAMRISIALL